MAPYPTRRALLAAAATLPVAAVAGCQGVGALASPPKPAPAVDLLARAIADEQRMVERYAAVLHGAAGRAGTRPRALIAALTPVQAEHEAHLARLRSLLVVPPGAAPPPGEHARLGTPPPSGPAAAIGFLRAAELERSAALLAELRDAPASLAQLLASISASEATHAGAMDAAARSA